MRGSLGRGGGVNPGKGWNVAPEQRGHSQAGVHPADALRGQRERAGKQMSPASSHCGGVCMNTWLTLC